KYMLTDGSGDYIPVATTRPETILGDSAVAVHPEDERYARFVGKQVVVPMLDRHIPVIADPYVTREFGTGALKITPAHDPNDYTIGHNHGLEFINIMTPEAFINENGGQYAGMERFACRKKIWADMREAGLVIKEEPYELNVPRSQRGGEIIEPMISTQWFVRIQPLADEALKAVQDGRIRIVPERFTKVYYNWLENIQDWCISRQLWWGHRIPVWYCDDCGQMTVARQDPTECHACHSQKIHQDTDVLDTWFSSGLWPFSTLGWPEETPDLKYFYPTSILETGYDILFFWVVRMIMSGLEYTGQIPFDTVYLHGLIRDEHGQKMSKSKGNMIDPLPLIEQMGADALRFTVLVGSTPGNDTNVGVKKIEANRNFMNKVWNAGRFVLYALEQAPAEPKAEADWTLADSWIWARLQTVVRNTNELFGDHQYGEAGRQIYEFFWGEFADWYLEIAKHQLAEGGDRAFYTAYTLARVLDTCLRLLHPFVPFITEEVWGYLKQAATERSARFAPKNGWEEALIVAAWPEGRAAEGWEEQKVADFTLVQEVVRAIRNLRAEKQVPPSKRIPATLLAGDRLAVLQAEARTLCSLAQLDPQGLTLVAALPEKPRDQVSTVVMGVEIFLPLTELVDAGAERARLEKDLAEIDSQIGRLETLLSSDFANKAPAAVVEKERQKLATYHETAAKLRAQLG
ncbi:MAG TPA: valine--tRNA ligase, partial [Anaerolineaceae bacterium]|nr:valine--tRNA ligase [Anaerolineaceae bacterium]